MVYHEHNKAMSSLKSKIFLSWMTVKKSLTILGYNIVDHYTHVHANCFHSVIITQYSTTLHMARDLCAIVCNYRCVLDYCYPQTIFKSFFTDRENIWFNNLSLSYCTCKLSTFIKQLVSFWFIFCSILMKVIHKAR